MLQVNNICHQYLDDHFNYSSNQHHYRLHVGFTHTQGEILGVILELPHLTASSDSESNVLLLLEESANCYFQEFHNSNDSIPWVNSENESIDCYKVVNLHLIFEDLNNFQISHADLIKNSLPFSPDMKWFE